MKKFLGRHVYVVNIEKLLIFICFVGEPAKLKNGYFRFGSSNQSTSVYLKKRGKANEFFLILTSLIDQDEKALKQKRIE